MLYCVVICYISFQPTFEKTNRLTIKAYKLFENEGMFEKDKKEEKKGKKKEDEEDHKHEESEDEEDEGQAHVVEESSSDEDEDEDFDGFDFDTDNPEFQEKMTDMMGDVFGTLFGGNQQTSQADKTGKGMCCIEETYISLRSKNKLNVFELSESTCGFLCHGASTIKIWLRCIHLPCVSVRTCSHFVAIR